MDLSKKKIAFIRARWHSEIVDQALKGFTFEAEALGFDPKNITIFDAPGGFEIPLIAKKAAQSSKFDAIVGAAWVVDGGIYRHDFVAAAVVDGLMRVQLDTDIPVFSVSLTPHNFQETDFHNAVYFEHMLKKGKEASHAVAGQLRTLAAFA